MKVLIACEYSGRVRDEFIKLGHDAMSCDLLPTDAPGPHYQGQGQGPQDHHVCRVQQGWHSAVPGEPMAVWDC